MRYTAILFVVFILTIWGSCISPSQNFGEEIYAEQCENCHQADGKGLGELIPNLNKSTYFNSDKRAELVCLIQNGVPNEDKALYMPPARLSDVELTNLLNYLEGKFSSKKHVYSLEEVNNAISKCN